MLKNKLFSGIVVSAIVVSTLFSAQNGAKIKGKKLSIEQIDQRFNQRFLNLKQTVDIDMDELDKEYLAYNENHNVINDDTTDTPAILFPTNGNSEIFQNDEDEVYLDKEENIIYKRIDLFNNQPKLSIIIDDVCRASEVDLIKQIPYKITPSFFPPTQRLPDTPLLAMEFEFYMVHLPLQAQSKFVRPQPNTLNIGDSQSKIYKTITEIKQDFPDANYINNHTGSAYTAHYDSMFKLFKALYNSDLNFVDSRTIGNSKAKEISEVFKTEFLERQVFLDNKQDKDYIIGQLLKAVKIAKIQGYAIAIGHPKTLTLEVLRDSSDLLDGVELVYVKDLK